MTAQVLRLFLSSPGDVPEERRRVDLVVERLNAEFGGRVRIDAIRWETSYYSAHDTFQRQIPEAADCDVVVAVFRARLGTPLPASFPTLPDGEPYPSGTAYEILSAIAVRKAGHRVPDVYVFRYPNAPSVALDAPDRVEIESQWSRLKGFFDRWFRTQGGEFLAAFQSYATTDEFAAQVEDCLRQWLARRGFLAQGTVWDRVLRGSPFPGLSCFEADRGTVFFGRDLAVTQAVERLREAGRGGPGSARLPFLLLIGASGSGKSSLMRAGLLPRLVLPGTVPEVDLWRPAVTVPGADPIRSLAEALFAEAALGPELRLGTFRTREMLAKQLSGDLDLALAPLRDALDRAAERRRAEAHFEAPRPARLALGIDQAERLLVEADADTAARFAALLAALVRAGLAYVVMALRSDAYARFQGNPALVALRDAGASFDLVPPSPVELEEIVTRPAAACSPPLAFEMRDGRSLAAALVADAKGGDALPLLQMTLARLDAAEAARGDGVLRFADYRGMDAAVTETADAALDGLDEPTRTELSALVTGLVADVTVDPVTGAAVPVVAALDRAAFEARRPHRRALVERFVERRLLTAEGDGDAERVRPVHEALLRIWPRAVAIVAEAGHLVRVRHTLEPLVRDWCEAPADDRARHLDLSPALLGGAQQLVASFDADVTPATRDFVAASSAASEARQRREHAAQEQRIRDVQAIALANRRTARRTGYGLVFALMLAAVAGWQWRVAQRETREAQVQRDRAERTLALATTTASSLVFDLAKKFQSTVGIPAATIRDILDRARKLQDQLIGENGANPALRRGQAEVATALAATLDALGDKAGELVEARKARDILQDLLVMRPGDRSLEQALSLADDRIGGVLFRLEKFDDALVPLRESLAIREALMHAEPTDEREHDIGSSYRLIGIALIARGSWDEALAALDTGRTLWKRLAEANPKRDDWQSDVATSDGAIGAVEFQQGRYAEAGKEYDASAAIAERLAAADPGDSVRQRDIAVASSRSGDVLAAEGHHAEALQNYRRSLAIEDSLAASDADNTIWQWDLAQAQEKVAKALVDQKNFVEALVHYQASIAIRTRLAAAAPGIAGPQRDLARADEVTGGVLLELDRDDEAFALYETARGLRERLVQAHPDVADDQSSLAWSEAKVGDLLADRERLPESVEHLKAALAIRERLAALAPGDLGRLRDVVHARHAIASMLDDQGLSRDALATYRASEAETERLVEADPSHVADRQDLYYERSRIGDMLVQLKDLDGADRAYRDSLAVALDIQASRPASPLIRTDIALADRKMGDTAIARGDPSEALDAYQAELAAVQAAAAADPKDASFQHDVAKAYGHLGVAYRSLARPGDARAALTAGREIVARLVADGAKLSGLQEQLDWFDGHLKLVDESHPP